MLFNYRLEKEKNLLSLTPLNLLKFQIGTPPVGDLHILWDETGLWEPIRMEKCLVRNYFCREQKH